MCLILLAWRAHPDFPLIVAANRDEHFIRPTEAAHFWPSAPSLLAGRDIQAGGAWMGITRDGRFAALTNYREVESRNPSSPFPAPPSRGRLVSDFLCGSMSAEAYLAALDKHAGDYRAFNLLCGTLTEGLWYYSNRSVAITESGSGSESGSATSTATSTTIAIGTPSAQHLQQPGIYGLSNSLLDVPWPKVAAGKSKMAQALMQLPHDEALFKLLRDDRVHTDARLPRTGVSLEWERVLSAAFIRAPHYGTRCSTILTCDLDDMLTFDEQTFAPGMVATPVATGSAAAAADPVTDPVTDTKIETTVATLAMSTMSAEEITAVSRRRFRFRLAKHATS